MKMKINWSSGLTGSSGATGSKRKLKRAGANRVISPYSIGGKRMAHAVVRPNVINFLEMTMQVDEYNLQMEELPVSDRAALQGKRLMDSKIRNNFNIIVLGKKAQIGGLKKVLSD